MLLKTLTSNNAAIIASITILTKHIQQSNANELTTCDQWWKQVRDDRYQHNSADEVCKRTEHRGKAYKEGEEIIKFVIENKNENCEKYNDSQCSKLCCSVEKKTLPKCGTGLASFAVSMFSQCITDTEKDKDKDTDTKRKPYVPVKPKPKPTDEIDNEKGEQEKINKKIADLEHEKEEVEDEKAKLLQEKAKLEAELEAINKKIEGKQNIIDSKNEEVADLKNNEASVLGFGYNS
eukprot:Pgem_evm1s9976